MPVRENEALTQSTAVPDKHIFGGRASNVTNMRHDASKYLRLATRYDVLGCMLVLIPTCKSWNVAILIGPFL